MQNLFISRLLYLGVWIVAAIVAAMFETDNLPGGFLSSSNEELKYSLNMLCVILTLAGTWGGLRLFSFHKVKELIVHRPGGLAEFNALRTAIFAVVIWCNLACYYAFYESSQLYCLLISIVGFLFCWPKHGEV